MIMGVPVGPPVGGTPVLPLTGQPGPMQPGEFKGGSASARTTFAFDKVSPPNALVVQRDDVILLYAQSNFPGGDTVNFNIRFIRVPEPQGGQPSDAVEGQPTGEVFDLGLVEFNQQPLKLAAGNVIPVTQQVVLGEGWLLSVTAVSNNVGSRGRTFARAILQRGGTGIFNTSQVLFEDYVTQNIPEGYPGGRTVHPSEGTGWSHSLNVATPAAGSDFNYTATVNQRLLIRSLAATLTTGAAVANRNVELIVDDGANIVWITDASASVAASIVQQFAATQTSVPTGVVTTIMELLIPPGLILMPGWRIRSNTVNLQAADQWSAIWMSVEEWFDNL